MRRRLNSRCKGLLEVGTTSMLFRDSSSHAVADQIDMLSNLENVANSLQPDPTVQYLHRTVKDFLESSAVWTQLLRATHRDFDPASALCRSSLATLKVTEPTSMGWTPFWAKITECIGYAYEAHQRSPSATNLIMILDELDRVADQLVNTPDTCGITFMQRQDISRSYGSFTSYQPHWTCTGAGSEQRTEFFASAVRLYFWSYSNLRFKTCSHMQKESRIWSLLLAAVFDTERFATVHEIQTLPIVEMIKLLFQGGADPNWKASPTVRIPWSSLLKDLPALLKYHPSRSSIKRVVEIFLEYGADQTLPECRELVVLGMWGLISRLKFSRKGRF